MKHLDLLTAVLSVALFLTLLMRPSGADLPTNFWSQVIRGEAKFVTDPPPREPTREQKLLYEAVQLIDKCREVAQLTVDRAPEGKRQTVARQCLDVTDPVEMAVEIGGVP